MEGGLVVVCCVCYSGRVEGLEGQRGEKIWIGVTLYRGDMPWLERESSLSWGETQGKNSECGDEIR